MESVLSESDWDSFSESSEEMDRIYGGNALSLLSNLEESITKIDDFLSFERGFILGDVVCSVTDPSGQMGRVVGLDMSVDLESTRGKIIREVSSKKLVRIRAISSGDFIVYGHWVGRVDKVVDSITVIFDDGAKSNFCPADPEQLVPIAPNLVDDSHYPYYPEQRVNIRLASASRSVKWLCGSWTEGQEEGTVQLVKAGLLHIEWLTSALVGCGVHSDRPPTVLKADDVTLLSCLDHANWQLGDWCMLGDHEDVNNKWNPVIGIDRMPYRTASEIYAIARTETRVDVVWQDGSRSFGMESQSLLPVNIVDAHDFWPEQFVQEKKSCQNPGSAIGHKFGIVRFMDAKEKTVNVIWRNASAENTDTSIPGQYEETVSAYELMDHPDYSVCIGDVVFKIIQNEAAAVEADKPEGTPNPDADSVYLSCFGNVIGFKDGLVEIKWAHGREEKVSPSEIIRVDKHEVSTASPVLLHGDDGQTAQRMADRQTDSSDRKRNDLLASADVDEVRGMDSSFSVSQYALGLLSSVASGLLGAFVSRSTGTHKQSALTSDDGDESSDSHPLVDGSHSFVDAQPNKDSSSLSEAHIDPMVEVKSDCLDEDIESRSLNLGVKTFKQFDMVTDCSDHHFFNNDEKGLDKSQVKRGWLRKIQQEWNILEKNLPEAIYVRVYEERMDLLRAAIVGPAGTPYHDGLFFFDIFLPPDYPNEPPMVHYRSGGLRINPNLYESGKVCLSLLNTWTGSGSEVWKPENSTILQVLVSLQALVLNDRPYFNEAGYDTQVGKIEGEKNSMSYNENTFLLNCQSMLYILRNPPKNFEALVDEHFGNCFRDILHACKEFVGGGPVGFPSGDGDHGSENNWNGRSSTGFKIMLTKLQARLMDAFVEKGMECYQFRGA